MNKNKMLTLKNIWTLETKIAKYYPEKRNDNTCDTPFAYANSTSPTLLFILKRQNSYVSCFINEGQFVSGFPFTKLTFWNANITQVISEAV